MCFQWCDGSLAVLYSWLGGEWKKEIIIIMKYDIIFVTRTSQGVFTWHCINAPGDVS